MLHDESLALHVGASGIRDEGLLDSALSRAVNLAHYEEPDFADLAAAYAIRLTKNHPFIDGNQRVAFFGGRFVFEMEWIQAYYEASLITQSLHPFA